jgi:hypothetical protein
VRECQGGRSPACCLSPPDLLRRSISHEVPNPETLNPISLYQPRTRSPAVTAQVCARRPKVPRGKGGCGNVKAEEAPHAVFHLRTSYAEACSHEVPNPKTLNPILPYQPRKRSPAVTAQVCARRPKVPRGKGGAGMSRRKKPRMLSFTSGPPTPKHAHTKFPTPKTLNPISLYQPRTSSPAVPKGPRGNLRGGCGNVKAEEAPHAVFHLRTSYAEACSHEVPNPKTLNPISLYQPRTRPPAVRAHAVRGGPRGRKERGVRECQGGRSPACCLSPPDLLCRSMFTRSSQP